MNAEQPDEFTENTLTQLLESPHVIRGFQVDALGIDLPAEGGDFSFVFGDPKPPMNHPLVDFQVKLKAIDIRAPYRKA